MNTQKTMQAIVQVCGSIDPSLGKMVSDTESKLGKINTKALAAGAAAGAIAVGVGKAVIEASKYLVDLGSEFDNAYDAIRIGTGATGEALQGLEDDFKSVYSSVPTTMEDASTAIADYNTRLGLTGPELQNISKQAIQVADLLDEDLGTVIEDSSKAFQIWNISADDMGGAMDYVFKASQSTGTGFNDLMADVQRFAPQLQELGYGFENSVALIGSLDKAGVNTTEVLSAMKKSVSSFAKEGLSAEEGLQKYTDKIKNAKDMTEATSIASEVFGTKAASTMASAIRDGSIDVANFAEELANSNETIGTAAEDTYDFAERLQMFKQKAEIALEPLASTMFDALNDIMPILGDSLTQLMPSISEIVNQIIPIINEILPQLCDLVGDILPVGSEILTSILPILIDLLGMIMPVLLQLIQLCLPVISQLLLAIMPIINELVNGPLGALFTALMGLMSEAAGPLGTVISFLASMFTERLSGALQAIMPIVTAVLNIFTNLLNFITNIFTGNWSAAWQNVVNIFRNIFAGVAGIVKYPINQIINGINSFISGVNSIKVPDWVPGVGGKSFSISKIPLLASGGFTNGPSIAGEVPGQTEAVISFLPQFRKENIELWQQAGQMLGVMPQQETPLQLAGQLATLDDYSLADAGATTIIYYDFSGFEYHPEFHNNSNNNDNEKTFMQEVEENKFEFADWLIAWFSTILED